MTTWENIVGHRWAVDLLRAGILHGRTGHAYLFTGPEQIGKRTLARTFAQALNCTAPLEASRPCGICRSCRLIATDRHPDVSLLAPSTSNRGKLTLKIDEIRELLRELNLAPVEGNYKIAIISRFDAATPGAANAFLKTLEEPPHYVKLLLTANEADMLLPTISSRCRTVTLRPLTTEQIANALIERTPLSDARIKTLAHVATGRLGWALNAAQQPELLTTRTEQLDLLVNVMDENRVTRFALAEKLSRKPESLPAILRVWISWWRDMALVAWGNGTPAMISNIDRLPELQNLAHLWQRSAIRQGLQKTNDTIWQLERNANVRLALEVLLLHYPYKRTGAAIA